MVESTAGPRPAGAGGLPSTARLAMINAVTARTWVAWPLVICGCGPDAVDRLAPPWPVGLDVVAIARQATMPVAGSPRFVAPGSAWAFDLEAGVEATLEVRAFEPRAGKEHDLSVCGVGLNGPLALRRRMAGAWRADPFVAGETSPSFVAVDPAGLSGLTTSIDCDRPCDAVVVKSAVAVGDGSFLDLEPLGDHGAVGLFQTDPDNLRTFYRSSGDELILAPELYRHPNPAAGIRTFTTRGDEVFVLHFDGQLWRVPSDGRAELYQTLLTAEWLTVGAGRLFAVGGGELFLVDGSTVSAMGPAPLGLSRFQGSSGERLFGIGEEGIYSWLDGLWQLELETSILARFEGNFSLEGDAAYYYSGDMVFRREPSGAWVPEVPPDTLPLIGGVVQGGARLAFGETGGLFYRPQGASAWCKLQSGTSQAIVSGAGFDGRFVVGTRSRTGSATVISIDPGP